jgi:hypothetical protein
VNIQKTLHVVALLLLVQAAARTEAGSLTTLFDAPGIRGSGVMFDVEVLGNPLQVTSFDLNLPTGAQTLALYSKPGTYVGFEGNAAAWTLVDILAGVAGQGAGTPTPVDFIDVTLPANATSALYLTSTDDQIVYSDGTAVGNVLADNADLRILEGTGVFYSFLPGSSPRQFNGTIHYELVPAPTAVALVSLGLSLLAMRRRK